MRGKRKNFFSPAREIEKRLFPEEEERRGKMYCRVVSAIENGTK